MGRRSPSVDQGPRGSQPNSRRGSGNPVVPAQAPPPSESRRSSNNPMNMQGHPPGDPGQQGGNQGQIRRGSSPASQGFNQGEVRRSSNAPVGDQGYNQGGEVRRSSNVPPGDQGFNQGGEVRRSSNIPPGDQGFNQGEVRRSSNIPPGDQGYNQGEVRRSSNIPQGEVAPAGSRRASSQVQDGQPPPGPAGDAQMAGSRRSSNNPQGYPQDVQQQQQQRGSIRAGEVRRESSGGKGPLPEDAGGDRRGSNSGAVRRTDLTVDVPPANDGYGGGSRKSSMEPSKMQGGTESRKGSHHSVGGHHDSLGPASPILTRDQVMPDSPQMRQAGFDNAVSVKQYLNATIVPILREALRALVKARPSDPYEFVGRYILDNKPR
ncbi:hypothetical protein CBR_g46203 [Chara braunii]|nr:hypothetical protein CBR_g46203 [Chara braunii]|eukprot:GBG87904.1 hypothetical protein CBR_g46203 [Chara braunii]